MLFADLRANPVDRTDTQQVVSYVQSQLARAVQMLEQKANELGIDLSEADDEQMSRELEETQERVQRDPLAMAARELYTLVEEAIAATGLDEDAAELEVVQHDQYFIAAKVVRALHGLEGDPDQDEEDPLTDLRSDANGSAKVALISIERSLECWLALMPSEAPPEPLRRIIEQLWRLREGVEKKFPHARRFVRPGFDTEPQDETGDSQVLGVQNSDVRGSGV